MTNNSNGTTGLIFNERLIFELSVPGKEGISLPETDVPEADPESLIPDGMVRDDLDGFPSISETEAVRHFTRLSQWNYGVDSGFYPLGSCTMKYNPKVHEEIAGLPGFSQLHPYLPEESVQGALRVIYELSQDLKEIGGMDDISLQPAAGAHGELAGMLMIRKYFESKGEKRHKVIIPDSAHGTNPASSALCGFEVVQLDSGPDGLLDCAALESLMTEDVAALMVTNPNTLGLFEKNISEISEVVHKNGGFVYCDGANLNALMGISRPGDMGVDLLHYNLHKTFSTPHGGGGPGAGPIGTKKELAPFLPGPTIEKYGESFRVKNRGEDSIGRLRTYYGNFGILLRAYAYIKTMGPDGLKQASETAVINANYIKEALKKDFHLPFDSPCMHECVFSDKKQSDKKVTTLDIAKALIDKGYHPPTVYFPLIVKGAIMIEPTETESKGTIDYFIKAMKEIARDAENNPEIFRHLPEKTKVSRLNETKAAREPRLRWVKKLAG